MFAEPYFGNQNSFKLSQKRAVFIHDYFGCVQSLTQSGIIHVIFLRIQFKNLHTTLRNNVANAITCLDAECISRGLR